MKSVWDPNAPPEYLIYSWCLITNQRDEKGITLCNKCKLSLLTKVHIYAFLYIYFICNIYVIRYLCDLRLTVFSCTVLQKVNNNESCEKEREKLDWHLSKSIHLKTPLMGLPAHVKNTAYIFIKRKGRK